MTHAAAARTTGLLLTALAVTMALATPRDAFAQDVPVVVDPHAQNTTIVVVPQSQDVPVVVDPSEYVIDTTSEVQLGQPFDTEPSISAYYPHQYSVDFAGFVDALDLGSLDLQFGETGIAALSGLSLGNAPFRSVTTGGITLNMAPRLWSILRFPELRMTLGGGSFDLPFMPVAGAPGRLSVRPESLFIFRLEVAAGLQYQLGPVVPYVLARCGLAYYSITNTVSHDRLGELGTEYAEAATFEAALDVGVNFRIHDNIEVGAAWRHQLYGADGDGLMFSLTVVGQ